MTLDEVKTKMQQAVEFLRTQYKRITPGLARPALVSHLMVDTGAARLSLNTVASITRTEPYVLLIRPFDASITKAIVHTLSKANLGATPKTWGSSIRLQFSPPSEERTEAMVRRAGGLAAEQRVVVRNTRRDARKKMEKDLHPRIEFFTLAAIGEIGGLQMLKEKELRG